MPGWPLSASTTKPESSAIAGNCVSFAVCLAFKIAFSINVKPVSSTSGTLNAIWATTSKPALAKSCCNSLTFP